MTSGINGIASSISRLHPERRYSTFLFGVQFAQVFLQSPLEMHWFFQSLSISKLPSRQWRPLPLRKPSASFAAQGSLSSRMQSRRSAWNRNTPSRKRSAHGGGSDTKAQNDTVHCPQLSLNRSEQTTNPHSRQSPDPSANRSPQSPTSGIACLPKTL